jgi:thiamine phosphate synthase YjbQ (UPF0047 family)
MWYQQTLTLSAKPRGFHLVTDEVIGQSATCRGSKRVCCICCFSTRQPLSR